VTNDQRPPAGFYPDPSGGTARRWWDGNAWTQTLEGSTANSGWSVQVGPDGRPVQPALPAGTKTDTALIWIFSVLPLASLVQLPLMDIGSMMRTSLERPTDPFAIYTPGYLFGMFVAFVLYAVFVLLAYLDYRNLRRVGVVQPFHWAWTFLSSIVYAIGRAVVLRRRVGSGFGPLWLYIATTVIGTIIVLTVTGIAIADAFSTFTFPTSR
jgi:hypothetical protein